MSDRLSGKVAVVTGGSGGIGTVTSMALALEGAAVVVADITAERAAAVAGAIASGGGEAIDVAVDVSDAESVETMVAAAVERFGRLDVLVANAAATHLVGQDMKACDISQEVFDGTMAVNARGTWLCCKYAVPAMIPGGGGSIIGISSGASTHGDDRNTAYGASKAAVNQLMRSVATQYGKEGIRANTILPGLILHEGTRAFLPREFQDVMLQNILTPDHAVAESIASTVVFFASDESRHITGEEVNVDGGLRAHTPQLAQMRTGAVAFY